MDGSLAERRARGALDAIVGDEAAFRDWYDAALPQVYRYLFHRCGRDRELAEELTQQTFVDALRSRTRPLAEDPVAWTIGIARHRLADHFRTLERRERGYLRLLAQAPQPRVTWAGETDAEGALVDALRGLPAMQRAAVTLRYLDDLPVRDIAALLGRSEGAVESLLSRGRNALRQAAGDHR